MSIAFSTPRPNGLRNVVIAGTGSYVPERIMPNSELETLVDTTDHWIVTRTGMKERRIAAPDEATSDMGGPAAQRALDDAKLDAADVDLILVATSTPDMFFPSTAALIQRQIGARNAVCMDIGAACSGFLYAMEVGRQFVATGSMDTVLVIGAEKMSSVVDWEDRGTCVLFGDAAGAAILRPGRNSRGILQTVMGSEGELADLLTIPAGGSRHPATIETVEKRLHYIRMDGQEVFRHAVSNMTRSAKEALKRCGLTIHDIRFIVPHQANARIIKAVGQRLGVNEEQVYLNVDKYGNTSAASVILAIDEASRGGTLNEGDLLLMVVFGAGFTWGASVVEWGRT